jgi:hypothetical protein
MLLPECIAPRPKRRVNFCLPYVKRLKSNARKAAIKKNKNWLEERRRSYDENIRRVREGLGTIGELTPRNEIVDDELEMSLYNI